MEGHPLYLFTKASYSLAEGPTCVSLDGSATVFADGESIVGGGAIVGNPCEEGVVRRYGGFDFGFDGEFDCADLSLR